MDTLNRRIDRNTRIVKQYLKGEILLAEGSTREALDKTQGLEPGIDGNISYESDMIRHNIPLSFRDLRARAWFNVGVIDSAIATYELLMSPRSGGGRVNITSPVLHLRLGALYEKKGELEKARNQYQTLLRIWNNPEKNLPELAEARSRLAHLRK
jgi:tetratricopeptide (TPR) repeat protein